MAVANSEGLGPVATVTSRHVPGSLLQIIKHSNAVRPQGNFPSSAMLNYTPSSAGFSSFIGAVATKHMKNLVLRN